MPTVNQPKVPLGVVVATPGALEAVRGHPGFLADILARHRAGDWGEVGPEDRKANDRAMEDGSRLVSAYTSPSGVEVWCITEADRSSTCLLLPSEY